MTSNAKPRDSRLPPLPQPPRLPQTLIRTKSQHAHTNPLTQQQQTTTRITYKCCPQCGMQSKANVKKQGFCTITCYDKFHKITPSINGIDNLPKSFLKSLPSASKVHSPVAPPRASLPVAPPRASLPVAPPRASLPVAPPRASLPVRHQAYRLIAPANKPYSAAASYLPSLICKNPACNRTFNTKSDLENHEKSHSSKIKIECDQCGQVFDKRSNLIAHLRIVHTKDKKKFPCSICSASFESRSGLGKHKNLAKNH
jgi:Zinc-finger double-stranded RNA-binding/Zinc finger, C2H2 type/C2H2-type zinc finger